VEGEELINGCRSSWQVVFAPTSPISSPISTFRITLILPEHEALGLSRLSSSFGEEYDR